MVQLKRAYAPAAASDGYRVLVERLWPRGVKKTDLALDDWLKDVAPSDELRRWFGHDPARWPEFVRRYRAELRKKPASTALAALVQRASAGPITLVYAARDEEHNGALVLRDAILAKLRRRTEAAPSRASSTRAHARSTR